MDVLSHFFPSGSMCVIHGLADQGLMLYLNFTLKSLCKALHASPIVIVYSLYQL